eukprot:1160207-Pelagomonas_calceolata.AAC.9
MAGGATTPAEAMHTCTHACRTEGSHVRALTHTPMRLVMADGPAPPSALGVAVAATGAGGAGTPPGAAAAAGGAAVPSAAVTVAAAAAGGAAAGVSGLAAPACSSCSGPSPMADSMALKVRSSSSSSERAGGAGPAASIKRYRPGQEFGVMADSMALKRVRPGSLSSECAEGAGPVASMKTHSWYHANCQPMQQLKTERQHCASPYQSLWNAQGNTLPRDWDSRVRQRNSRPLTLRQYAICSHMNMHELRRKAGTDAQGYGIRQKGTQRHPLNLNCILHNQARVQWG